MPDWFRMRIVSVDWAATGAAVRNAAASAGASLKNLVMKNFLKYNYVGSFQTIKYSLVNPVFAAKVNIESKPGLGFSAYTDGGQKNPGSSNRMTRASPTGRWWHNPATGGF